MTKKEYEKLEKLMEEAIRNANNSKEEYKEYQRLIKEGKEIDAKCRQRIADHEAGYAEGINQVIVTLGFKHERMRVLADLL